MRKLISFLILSLVPVASWAASSQTIANEVGLTYSTTYQVNLNAFGSPQISVKGVAAAVTYSTVTYNTATFTDGSRSTGSVTFASTNVLAVAATNQITVPSTALILGAPATNQMTVNLGSFATGQITIVSTNGITGASVTINGVVLAEGVAWTAVNTASGTARAISNAIMANANLSSILSSTWTLSVVYATATYTGTQPNNWVILSSTPTAISPSATFRGGVDSPIKSTATITVNGYILRNGVDWISTGSSSSAARSIADVLDMQIPGLSATSVGNVVYASATVYGTAGNAFTLADSDPALATAASTFSGGKNKQLLNANIVFNGVTYPNGIYWTDVSGTSTGTAASIVSFLNKLTVIVSTTNGVSSVIYATATPAGVLGNSYTLSSASMTVAAPTFTNGQDSATFVLNGVTFTAGVSYATGTTSNNATNLAAAINASVSSRTFTAQANAAKVTSTSTLAAVPGTYTMSTNLPAALTLSGATLTGGTSASFSITTELINIPSHGFTKALPVLLSTNGATIGGLVNQTTYYVVVIDPNFIGLSSTSLVAQTGNYITFTSSAPGVTPNSPTLVPLSYSGVASAKWQVSNDGTNWADYPVTLFNVPVSSYTFFAVNPSTTVVQDFGQVDYGWIQLKVVGPSQGGLRLKATVNGKE